MSNEDIDINSSLVAQHPDQCTLTMGIHPYHAAIPESEMAATMDELAQRHLNHRTIRFAEVAGTGKAAVSFDRVALDRATCYAAEDADVTLRLWRVLKPRLAAERRTTVYETLERALIDVVARMEMRGIAVDRQLLSRLSGDFAQTLARLEHEIHELAGATFSPSNRTISTSSWTRCCR